MIRLIPGCGLVIAFALVATPPAPARSGESIADMLRVGRAVVLSGETIRGRLDLSRAGVRGIFKCRACTFSGAFSAPDATFERTFDVGGSQFKGTVDLSGATFRAPALFRRAGEKGKERPTTFRDNADFSLATFEDLVSFADSQFRAAGTFRDTRFADVTFASARFSQTGDFERASFRGTASFNRATFKGEATLREGDFRRGASFVQTRFRAGGVFNGALFGDNASFLNATFVPAETSEEAARFQNVTAVGSLDFTFAEFKAHGDSASPNDSRIVAIFSDVVCGQSLVFRKAGFAEGHRITMLRVQARDLVLDVGVVPEIDDPDDQRTILQAIEESAKSRGDLAVANDAHYALLASRSDDYWVGWRALDYVFHRGTAGYFVRPFRPLLVLLALATMLSVLRFVRRPPSAPVKSGGSRLSRFRGRVRSDAADLLTGLLDTLSSIKSGRISDPDKTRAVGERIEVFVYRLLLVCALIGLANSNPTLREMFDTVV